MPGARIGGVLGYGAAYDYYGTTTGTPLERYRILVLAAERNGVVVVAVASGPFVLFANSANAPGDGQYSPADLVAALVMDPELNSVTWSNGRNP